MKKASIDGEYIEVKFWVSKPLWSGVTTLIKSIPGYMYNPVRKSWFTPYTLENVEILRKGGFRFDNLPVKRVKVELPPEPQKEFDESVLSRLPYTLRDYQIKACRFLHHNNWNGLLSLGPRMGKTVCSLVGTLLYNIDRTVVVTTATGKGVWKEEIHKWLKQPTEVLEGVTPYYIPQHTKFIVCNYAIVSAWTEALQQLGFGYLIVDESHYVSNDVLLVPKTEEEYEADKKRRSNTSKSKEIPVQCTQAFKALAFNCPHVVELSGTPMTVCPAQIRVPLSIWEPAFHNKYWFLNKFCDPVKGDYGWTYEGLSHEEILLPVLAKWIFRRTKHDIWDELPQECHQFIPVKVDKKLYEKELSELKENTRGMSEDDLELLISRFESLSYSQKRTAIIDWVNEFLETGEKITLFCWHRLVIEDLYKVFKKKAIMIYGGVDPKERASLLKSFTEDPKISIAVLQIKSCMEAITLAGDTIAFVEMPPTAGMLQQASERIWKAESRQKKLSYFYFTAEGTLDKERIERIKKRAKVLGTVLDSGDGFVFGEPLSDIIERS